MREEDTRWSRWGAVALGLSALLFAAQKGALIVWDAPVFPLVRPVYTDLALDPTGAAQMISAPLWMVSHLLLIVALVLLPFGLLAVFADLASSHVRYLALIGMVLGIAGAGLFLPVLGVETFALPPIARMYLQGHTGVLGLIGAARSGLQATVFLPGLALLGLGGVFTAIAVWRSSRLPRWAGIPFAIGLVFFMPLFPQVVRIVDGLLTGVGGLWLAFALWENLNASARAEVSPGRAEATPRA